MSAQDSLDLSPAHVRLMLDCTASMIFVTDRNHRYLFSNAAYAKYLGVEAQAVVGRTHEDFYPADVAATFVERNTAIMASGEAFQSESEVCGRIMLSVKSPLKGVGGNVVGLVGVVTDITDRKRMESELRDSEAKFLAFMESLPVAAFMKDEEFRSIYLNPAAAALLDTDVETALGATAEAFLVEEEAAVVRRDDLEVAAKKRPIVVEQRVRTGGVARILQTHKFPIPRSDKGIIFGGISVDITKLRVTEARLQEALERYRSVVSSMAEGVVLQCASGEIVEHNEQAERILELSHDQLLGKTSVDLDRRTLREDGTPFPGEEHPAMETLRTGKPCRNVVMGIQSAGRRVRWININTEPLYGPLGGKPQAVVASFLEITERVEEERRLRTSERQVRLALAAGNIGAWELDLLTHRSVQTYRHDQIFGYEEPQTSWTFERFVEHVHEDDRDRIVKLFLQVTTHDLAANFQCRIRRKDGAVRWVHYMADFERVFKQRPTRMFGLIQDVTDDHQAETARIERARSEMRIKRLESLAILAGGIAHDFNNLLCAIQNATELASAVQGKDSPANEFLALAQEATQKASGLCKQMLAYSGRGRFKLTTLSLSACIREFIPTLRDSIQGELDLIVDIEEDAFGVEADVEQVQLLLQNLVLNAAESYTSGKRRVELRTESVVGDPAQLFPGGEGAVLSGDSFVLLQVTDQGQGIAPETLADIFDPFFSTKGSGRGLGLSAVRGIAAGHNARIFVTSELGRGTTVKVVFPSCNRGLSRVAVVSSEPPTERPRLKSILVVDDEAVVRRTTTRILQLEGYSVETANDGLEAVERIRKKAHHFDLVLLDLTMPILTGDRAFSQIKALNPGIRVILMSGFDHQQISLQFGAQKPDGFLSKPFDVSELRKMVSTVFNI